MERFVGHHRGEIRWVSSEPGEGGVAVPPEFSELSDRHVLSNLIVKRGQVMKKPDFSNPSKHKAAFISVWGIQCGISTYSEWLWPELGKYFQDWHVFAEVAPGKENYSEPKVTRCWKRGESLQVLLNELERFGPDVVYIQHEWGIFPDARYWLALMSALHHRYRVVVCFHSIYPAHRDKAICLAAAPEIIVHTPTAARAISGLGVSRPTYVVPHGCLENDHGPKPWNMLKSEHTIVQFGFGFRYKGWHVALEVVHELREKFPDVFFTGLFSVPANAGQDIDQYFGELQERIDQLKLRDHVALIKGFQDEVSLKDYLRIHRVALFPYVENGKHAVLGCSGAARFTMAQGIPIVTTRIPLFEDLDAIVPRGDTPRELAAQVAKLFDRKSREGVTLVQDKFLEANSWARAGERYAAVLRSGF